MNTTIYWLRILATILILLVAPFSTHLFGQSDLYTAAPGVRLLPEQAAHLEEIILNPATESWDVVRVDASVLERDDVVIPLGSQRYQYTITSRRLRDHDRFSLTGLLNGQFGRCSFVVNGEKVTGMFKIESEQYMLLPLGGGVHVLFRQNPPADEGGCVDEHSHDSGKHDKRETESDKMQGLDPYLLPGLGEGLEAAQKGVAEDCKLRMLVAYTPGAAASFDDMLSFVQLAIDEINFGNEECLVNYEVELARVMRVNFDEGALTGDSILTLFQTEGDSVMDDTHDDRRLFDADMCALLIRPNPALCGIAATIRSTYSSAFHVTVALNCAVSNHSFMHETGHLLGCRHDVFVDDKETPYPWGHGYVWYPDLWRTVMAYNDFCDCQDEWLICPDVNDRETPFFPWCDRLPFWSSPDLTFNGIPFGSDTLEDNVRVWNTYAPNVINFESYIVNKQFYDSRLIAADESFDIHGANSVVIGDGETVEIQAGGSGQFRAGHEIVIGEGFHAVAGSEFSAVLQDCTPVPVSIQDEDPVAVSRSGDTDQGEALPRQVVQVGAFPNPFSTQLTVKVQTTLDALADVRLTDVSGRTVRAILSAAPITGRTIHYQEVDVTGLLPGQYFVVVKTADQQHAYPVIKIK